MDDVIIFGIKKDEHIEHVDDVLRAMKNINSKPSLKSVFSYSGISGPSQPFIFGCAGCDNVFEAVLSPVISHRGMCNPICISSFELRRKTIFRDRETNTIIDLCVNKIKPYLLGAH
ncbi:hypothetical protein RF11_00362 [Thelohanellus kitauei]|uniref:Reverse transcriptase domain-containing protein n=1 Tax=Thelohanellus kitauei TaxID=669202 RepID=A0A0C2J7L7_THEKT|nr:hypothetical protein RF11_00362 [Thelohanellus kitauei]